MAPHATAQNSLQFHDVTGDAPCDICGKPDWCSRGYNAEGKAVLVFCRRDGNNPALAEPGLEYLKQSQDGSAMYRVTDSSLMSGPPTKRDRGAGSERNWHTTFHALLDRTDPVRLDELAKKLQLDRSSLDCLDIAWATRDDLRELRASGQGWQDDYPDGGWVFPEVSQRTIVGLSVRTTRGTKGFCAGGKRGLVVPRGLDTAKGLVYVVEGASDVLACAEMGMTAVGRPSNAGGLDLLRHQLARHDLIVLGENDLKNDGKWPGRDGARSLARQLYDSMSVDVSWSLPPETAKDVRTYLADAKAAGVPAMEAGRELKAHLRRYATQDFAERPTFVKRAVPRAEWQRELVEVAKRTGKILGFGNQVWTEAGTELHPVSHESFASRLDSVIDYFAWSKDANRLLPGAFPKDVGSLARESWFRRELQQIDLYTRTPVVMPDGDVINSPGYHAASRVYYEGSEIPILAGTERLDRYLDVVNFMRASDRAAAVAAMLSVLLKPWFAGAKPMVAVVGNQPAVGKSSLARAIGHVEGDRSDAIGWSSREEELEKQLGTVFARGSQVVTIDNVRPDPRRRDAAIGNTTLESLVTSERYGLRRLGTNEMIEGPNHPLILMTLNEGEFTTDLASRILWCRLFYEGDANERSDSPIGPPDEYIRRHRVEILGELLGMVCRWQRAGRPRANVPGTRFPEWAQVVGGILECNGVGHFLEDHQTDRMSRVERDTDLEALALACPDQPLAAKQWVQVADEAGVFAEITAKTGRAASQAMARKLQSCAGRAIRLNDDGEIRRYELRHRTEGTPKNPRATYAFVSVPLHPGPETDDDPGKRTTSGTAPSVGSDLVDFDAGGEDQVDPKTSDDSPCFHSGSDTTSDLVDFDPGPEAGNEMEAGTGTPLRGEGVSPSRASRPDDPSSNDRNDLHHTTCPSTSTSTSDFKSEATAPSSITAREIDLPTLFGNLPAHDPDHDPLSLERPTESLPESVSP